MGIRKITKTYLVVAVGLTVLVVNQLSVSLREVPISRVLRHVDTSYSSSGSITAVINTAKMGTLGLEQTFTESWGCSFASTVNSVKSSICENDRRSIRTHDFESGSEYIQKHREEHPQGRCLVVTALRNPASWFGLMYLQMVHDSWKPKEEMIQGYREYLATDGFDILYKSIPSLLKEFDAGTLTEQAKIMDDNGGYSLISAPGTSVLAGCDLLFLRMEQSDRWPFIFEMLDREFRNIKGKTTAQRYLDNVDQVDAIASYELTSEEKTSIYNRQDDFIREWFNVYGYMDNVSAGNPTKSYSVPGSISAVINTAKMGTGGLDRTFSKSWNCKDIDKVNTINPRNCKDERHSLRTHSFKDGSEYIQDFREEHPQGQCIIATALRSPASWFASMYLQMAKQNWKPKEEMIQGYREFLATDDFHMLGKVIPDILKEFNAGTLAEQAKIMDDNGGYSVIPAPTTSALAGCDLLFLRMEQSDHWPNIFHMLDPEFRNIKGKSRVEQHEDNFDQINAIASYELTSDEKINIYNRKDDFIREWFNVYGYMGNVEDESTKDGETS